MMKKHYKGVCYQGYRNGQARSKGIFPTKAQILEDLLILEQHFDAIRVYDCSKHTEDILAVIQEHKIHLVVMLSMYMRAEHPHNQPSDVVEEAFLRNKQLNDELAQKVIRLANEYRGIVCCVSAGNEARSIWNVNQVSDGRIAELVSMIKQGVTVPVTYCDEWKTWVDELPKTVQAVDFLSIHIYPVWNGIGINEALEYTKEKFQIIQSLYPEKFIIITEAGWPTQTDQKRIPLDSANASNQNRYVSEIIAWSKEIDTTIYIFEAFDEEWKGYNDPLDPEKNWGLYYDSREKKFVGSSK